MALRAERMKRNIRWTSVHIIHNGVVLPGKWNVRKAIPGGKKQKERAGLVDSDFKLLTLIFRHVQFRQNYSFLIFVSTFSNSLC